MLILMIEQPYSVQGRFGKAMMLARISRVMSIKFAFASLIASAMRAMALACGAVLTDHATLRPSLAQSARVTLQDRDLSAAVLNAAAGDPSDAVRLFEAGAVTLRNKNWEMQSIGRALLVLGEVAYAGITNPADEISQARERAYQGEQGEALREAIMQDRRAFECALACFTSGTHETVALPAAVRATPPPSAPVDSLLFAL